MANSIVRKGAPQTSNSSIVYSPNIDLHQCLVDLRSSIFWFVNLSCMTHYNSFRQLKLWESDEIDSLDIWT